MGNGPEDQDDIPRIGKEQADAEERKAKAAGTALLDAIEKTRATQGDYFSEIGTRGNVIDAGSDNQDLGKDTRLIVFNTPVAIGEGEEARAITVTQDGVFFVNGGTTYMEGYAHVPEGRRFSNGSQEFIKRIGEIDKDKKINTANYLPAEDNKPARVYTHGYGSHERKMEFELAPVTDESIFTRARDESIRNTESPHKARAEAAQMKIQTLTSLTESMNQLHPRE